MSEKFTIPIAIIIAGGLLAGAVYFSHPNTPSQVGTLQPVAQATSGNDVPPISADDHILGSPNADVIILEYSDTECPYCKQFHPVLRRVMDEYGKDGKVAWVYRHFPIAELHSKAPKEAEATECVNELGGPTKFWLYLNMIYDETPANNGLDPIELPKIASAVGVDVNKFNSCLASGKYTAKVQAEYDQAIKAGAQGTPYSILITKDGQKYPLSGAQTYDNLKVMLDALLQK